MLFAVTGTIHSHLTHEQRNAAFARRAEGKPSEGVTIVGEWWQFSAPQILIIVETESLETLRALNMRWSDVMEITVSPAQTAEQGMASAAKFLASR